jgi:hypothetical protein
MLNSRPQPPFAGGQRVTRRRSSAGPIPPVRPQQRPREQLNRPLRPTFLTLRDHGKVYVADLPRLSDGQLAHVSKEAREVLESISRRLLELESLLQLSPPEQDTRIRAATKRDVTERFIRAIEEEQELRRNNPMLREAAAESVARTFLELARHRLPGATFDALLQEALAACGPSAEDSGTTDPEASGPDQQETLTAVPQPRRVMPVVLTPAPEAC